MLADNEIEALAHTLESRLTHHKTSRWKRLLFLNFGVSLAVLCMAEVFRVEVLFKGFEVVSAAGIHWMFFGRSE